ncbi:ankyrin repeat-containing domain protein [Baffinella frigidus]|nr:ankyrin repeat-containing domain protein [Cryptophyta sp. CCMP2293]
MDESLRASTTPLMVAAIRGFPVMASQLIKAGASTATLNPRGFTALHFAARNDSGNVVAVLFANSADVTLTATDGKTPAHVAVVYNRPSVLKQLLQHGFDINIKHFKDAQPLLHTAVQLPGRLEILKVLLQGGADGSMPDLCGRTAMICAVQKGNAAAVAVMIQYSVDVNARADKYGKTPLHHAVAMGNAGLTEMLLNAGADIEVKDNAGYRPLHHAAANGQENTTQILMDWGADLLAKLDAPLNRFDTTLNPKPQTLNPKP